MNGFGRAVTYESVKILRKMGADFCILQATDLGKIIYEKIGFQEKCKLLRYYVAV
jgi:hypothetical protein